MPNELRGRFREALPSHVLQLMDEVEGIAGKEISIEMHPHGLSKGANRYALAYLVTPASATIFVRDPDQIYAHGAAHELLHIQERWVAKMPILAHGLHPALNIRAFEASEEVAHIAMAPREAAMGFDPEAYWSKAFRHTWAPPDLQITEPQEIPLILLQSLTTDDETQNWIISRVEKQWKGDKNIIESGLVYARYIASLATSDREKALGLLLALLDRNRSPYRLAYTFPGVSEEQMMQPVPNPKE